MPRTILHPEAEADFASAISYFKSEARIGTADKFRMSVADAVSAIESNPEGCPVVIEGYRRQRVFNFSYELVYRMVGEDILIVAVSHASRKPLYWRDRR